MSKNARVELLKDVLATDSYGWVELYEPLLREIDHIEHKLDELRDKPILTYDVDKGKEVQTEAFKAYSQLLTKYHAFMNQINSAYRSMLSYLEREINEAWERENG